MQTLASHHAVELSEGTDDNAVVRWLERRAEVTGKKRYLRAARALKVGHPSWDDREALLVMEFGITNGTFASVEEASRSVANRAVGYGTDESKAKRLAGKFRNWINKRKKETP